MIGQKAKEVTARLGDPKDLRSVTDTIRHIGGTVSPRLSRYITESKRIAADALKPLNEKKLAMTVSHKAERQKLDQMQQGQAANERCARSARVRRGIAGAWDILTGRYFKVRKQNEMEAHFGQQRDRNERHDLVQAQLKDRQGLQTQIVDTRRTHARQMIGLYRDAARYRQMARDGSPPRGNEGRGPSAPRGPELGR